MSVNIVILHFGHVESAKLTALVCTTDKVFESSEEAIKDLAEELLAKYKARFEESKVSYRKCCIQARKKSENVFCNKCGSKLNVEFDEQAFINWLYDLTSLDLDSYGYDEVCGDREIVWEIGESPNLLLQAAEGDVACVDRAEVTLLKILGLINDWLY